MLGEILQSPNMLHFQPYYNRDMAKYVVDDIVNYIRDGFMPDGGSLNGILSADQSKVSRLMDSLHDRGLLEAMKTKPLSRNELVYAKFRVIGQDRIGCQLRCDIIRTIGSRLA